jgi:Mn2+/Fe2+ NRAMP family transporter
VTRDLDTATTASEAPAPARRTGWRRITLIAAIAGPGLVAANAGNDAAGIATYASAGSQFTYGTLFFMVLVTIALVMVQEMAVRLGAHTGKGLGALIREQFSLRLTALAVFCLLLANTAWSSASSLASALPSNSSAYPSGWSSRRPRSCCGRWFCSAPTTGPNASS